MAIDNQCDEAIDGSTNYQKDGDSHVRPVKLTTSQKLTWRQSTKTPTDRSTKKSTEKSTVSRPRFH